MIKGSTYHAHTTYCDGKNTPEEMVTAAIERGCPELGLSPHSPLPWLASYTMRTATEPLFFAEMKELRDKYSDKIRLYSGIERDIFTDMNTDSYDYVIGSVHYVIGDGLRFDVDASAQITRRAINDAFGGDPYAYAEAYYSLVSEVYDRTKCDIIGHFDLLTKFIERDPIFSITHPRYVAARNAALDRLLQPPAIFEVNTGAIHRGYRTTPYPDDEVLLRIAAAGKPVAVTSDSHSADTVDYLIDQTRERLADMGVRCVSTMSEILQLTRGKSI
jgi:histidinol-phosphatase (PHP family)